MLRSLIVEKLTGNIDSVRRSVAKNAVLCVGNFLFLCEQILAGVGHLGVPLWMGSK